MFLYFFPSLISDYLLIVGVDGYFFNLSRSIIALDGGSGRYRGVFMHKHETLTRYRRPYFPPRIEPAIPASQRPQNHP